MRRWHLAWIRWKPILPRLATVAAYALTGTGMRVSRREPSQAERSAIAGPSTKGKHLRAGNEAERSLGEPMGFGSRAKGGGKVYAEETRWSAADRKKRTKKATGGGCPEVCRPNRAQLLQLPARRRA